MPRCQAHDRPINRCGRCLPKKFWPKDRKPCRCGYLMWKDQHTCHNCLIWDDQDWRGGGHKVRRVRSAVIRQVNA